MSALGAQGAGPAALCAKTETAAKTGTTADRPIHGSRIKERRATSIVASPKRQTISSGVYAAEFWRDSWLGAPGLDAETGEYHSASQFRYLPSPPSIEPTMPPSSAPPAAGPAWRLSPPRGRYSPIWCASREMGSV